MVANCSISNSETETPPPNYKNLWHLTNVSGGIAGVNENFELKTIIWSFNDVTQKLTVTNNNSDDVIQDGLDSGVYDYSILNANDSSYLVVNDNELGELTFSQTAMQINGNKMSEGEGADGFIYLFQLQVVLAD